MSTPSPLAGRTIVVTGGFGVLGQAAVDAALAASARVAAVDRGGAPATVDASVVAVSGIDLADPEAARQAFERIGREFGRIDALLNIAGAFEWRPVQESEAELWRQLYSANVLTAVNACRAALPLMQQGAAIVNVAAAAARRAAAGMAAYTAAKSGVLRLTEALAEELQPRRIRVNAVSPTIIDTPRNRADMPDADFASWVAPERLARTMLYLASSDAAAINGAEVLVAGGG